MSRACSVSQRRPFSVARICQEWGIPRSTFVTDVPNKMWATDATATFLPECGQVTIVRRRGPLQRRVPRDLRGSNRDPLRGAARGRRRLPRGQRRRRCPAPRPWRQVCERGSPAGPRLPRPRVLAGVGLRPGGRRRDRAVPPHPQGAAAMVPRGPHLGGAQRGPAALARAVQPGAAGCGGPMVSCRLRRSVPTTLKPCRWRHDHAYGMSRNPGAVQVVPNSL